jgi:hypothetical protein
MRWPDGPRPARAPAFILSEEPRPDRSRSKNSAIRWMTSIRDGAGSPPTDLKPWPVYSTSRKVTGTPAAVSRPRGSGHGQPGREGPSPLNDKERKGGAPTWTQLTGHHSRQAGDLRISAAPRSRPGSGSAAGRLRALLPWVRSCASRSCINGIHCVPIPVPAPDLFVTPFTSHQTTKRAKVEFG